MIFAAKQPIWIKIAVQLMIVFKNNISDQK